MHSHLQSKQKYRISSYGCSLHYLLDDIPVNCLSVLAKVAGFSWLTFDVFSYEKGYLPDGMLLAAYSLMLDFFVGSL